MKILYILSNLNGGSDYRCTTKLKRALRHRTISVCMHTRIHYCTSISEQILVNTLVLRGETNCIFLYLTAPPYFREEERMFPPSRLWSSLLLWSGDLAKQNNLCSKLPGFLFRTFWGNRSCVSHLEKKFLREINLSNFTDLLWKVVKALMATVCAKKRNR